MMAQCVNFLYNEVNAKRKGELTMKITLTPEALAWFKDDMIVEKGDYVRFFVRYGGCSTVQKGFSLGVEKQKPIQIGSQIEEDGIIFYVEEEDLWYFDGHDLEVDFNKEYDEPVFKYE